MNDDGDYCSCSQRRVRDIDRGGACTARLASVGSLRPDEPETSASGVPQEVFGRYQILSRIALGGMAEVLLARSLSFSGVSRTCVIKRIRGEYSRDSSFVSRFIDEARITMNLAHKNIVKVYDFGQHEGVYFIAMEYIDGATLSALMRIHREVERGMAPTLAAFVAREIANGLHHAHKVTDQQGRELNVVHRDVSPHNVLLSSAGQVKLTDFGIAAAQGNRSLTVPGTVLGKTAYMAPEQAKGDKIDGATDIWALGVILHEMLSGARLFADASTVMTLRRVLHGVIPPPSAKVPSVPKELDRIVMRALERKPRARYGTADALALELSAYLQAAAVRPAGPCAESNLSRALTIANWNVGETQPALRPLRRSRSNSVTQEVKLPREDAKLLALVANLKEIPDLWTLVAIGDHYEEQKQRAPAISAYRTAAALFAHRGLLVQALCVHQCTRTLLDDEEGDKDLLAFGGLVSGDRCALVKLLTTVDRHGFWPLMQSADPDGLGSEDEAPPFALQPTPLFGFLSPVELADIGRAIRVRHVPAGDVVIREGHAGDALFAVGRGRLIVYCNPRGEERTDSAPGSVNAGMADSNSLAWMKQPRQDSHEARRVHLAGLADGDFFGEFSFLAERPRSATVEAIADCRLLEIDRGAVAGLLKSSPAFREPLERFYRERIIELMMAKSPVFSLLEPRERKGLLNGGENVECQGGEIIVEADTRDDRLYFIKRGEVEIFRKDHRGNSIFIDKLVAGQFFGEIAALRGTLRTASVRAMGNLSLLRIEGAAVLEIVRREPALKALFDLMIASRMTGALDRVREHAQVVFDT